MKITAEHLQVMRDAIVPLDTEEARATYRSGDFPRADQVKDLDERYRWDLFWRAWENGSLTRDGLVTVAHYKDSHIDTALRFIVSPLGGKA
jgi:hypothetical protein